MEDFVYSDYDYEDDGEVEYADYYEDDAYTLSENSWEKNEENEAPQSMTLEEVYRYCIITTFSDSYKHLIGILSWSLLFLFSSRIIKLPSSVIHLSSAFYGGILLWQMFDWRCNLMGGLFLITYLNLLSSHYVLKQWRGPSSFVIGIIYLLMCERWIANPLWWHAIRGIQMVILMKLVSIGYDIDSCKLQTIPGPMEMIGYTFCPGTVIFGPWIPFSTYMKILTPMKWHLSWVLRLVVKALASLFFLIFSTCCINWFIPDHSNRWFLAYRDALSFRTSHYFVSYLSEVSSNLSGIEVEKVSSPFSVEIPRSLVEAVIQWNNPMHQWLKSYVFKPTYIKFGSFLAIILTYGMSALFHGLNFQLAAVLFSLGFYTYTEYMLRSKLANIFDACVSARKCCGCNHRLKASSGYSVLINTVFGVVAAFHLAYLGMMFDSTDQMQEQGYSMVHTIKKWSALNYSSHWLALFMYILMSVL